MEKLLRLLQGKLIRGEACILVTVLSQQGSAPRGAGAALFMDESGQTTGTIGGGAIEAMALKIAQACMIQKRSLFKRFNLKDAAGMICGGEIELLFQYMDAPMPLPKAGIAGWLLTDVLRTDAWSMRFAPIAENFPNHPCYDGHTFSCPIGQRVRVWLFGAGHVAQALAPLLHQLDFACIVLDDRAEYASVERFPTADDVRVIDFEHIELDINPQDAVCIMTRGHRSDYVVQCQVLHTPAMYLGLMGSRNKVALTREKLLHDGFSQRQIDRFHMPIGMDISSDTLMEIAVSIAGELIQYRARLQGREKNRELCSENKATAAMR